LKVINLIVSTSFIILEEDDGEFNIDEDEEIEDEEFEDEESEEVDLDAPSDEEELRNYTKKPKKEK